MQNFLKNLFFSKQVKIEEEILGIADQLKDSLLPQDIQNIRESIKHNEFGNAFEILCIQIFEYNLPISQEIYDRIETLGKQIGCLENHWNLLKSLIIH